MVTVRRSCPLRRHLAAALSSSHLQTFPLARAAIRTRRFAGETRPVPAPAHCATPSTTRALALSQTFRCAAIAAESPAPAPTPRVSGFQTRRTIERGLKAGPALHTNAPQPATAVSPSLLLFVSVSERRGKKTAGRFDRPDQTAQQTRTAVTVRVVHDTPVKHAATGCAREKKKDDETQGEHSPLEKGGGAGSSSL